MSRFAVITPPLPRSGFPVRYRGFTLIELSIVLVIIGLIVGGVLVGQDLIKAAEVRAQISQIEKFNTAVRTFQGKYGYLPGDIPDPYATQFGFTARGTAPGQGDGNGIISGWLSNAGNPSNGNTHGIVQSGEPLMVWVDLSTSKLINGDFSTATSTTIPGADVTGGAVAAYYPKAKLGEGIYVYFLNCYSNRIIGFAGYNPNPICVSV